MIDIAEFSGKTLQNILTIIEDENTQEYEIYVPKSTQRFFSERSDIAYDYAYAAYSGQLLAGVASKFSYDEVPPEQHESITFVVTADNKELLAKTILDISFLYVNESADDNGLDIEDVNKYIEDVEGKQIVPACPYFMELFFEFNGEEQID